MQPIPTGVSPRLVSLDPIRAVIIDIYGTLVISGSGDVGTAKAPPSNELAISGGDFQSPILETSTQSQRHLLRQEIERIHSLHKSQSNPRPEVEILDVWRTVLMQTGRGAVADQPDAVARAAAEYEACINPTWPMPGGGEVIEELQRRNIRLGIVSNAQVFTIPIVEQAIGGTLASRFDLDLCLFSNRYRSSKPGTLMFDRLVTAMRRSEIEPHEAVYVGNDMLNDVYAASQAGLKTALFAGDARSLRLREDHPACADLSPDVVLTEWAQLLDCIKTK
ncbi:HAD family hydrolase [Neorhodopirellula pilleata]|nr:HAD family hydrolase [Neorhodopirellula pilleata]